MHTIFIQVQYFSPEYENYTYIWIQINELFALLYTHDEILYHFLLWSKKDEIMYFAATWMELENIMLSEVGCKKTSRNQIVYHIWG